MLHMLLQLAAGDSGDLVLTSDAGLPTQRWQLRPELQASASELAAAVPFLRAGAACAYLRNWVASVRGECHGPGDSCIEFIYVNVLCQGVAGLIAEWEERLELHYSRASMGASVVPLSSVLSRCAAALRADDSAESFAAVAAVCAAVAQDPKRCLTILDQQATRQPGAAGAALRRLLGECNGVLLRHIADWVVWGETPAQQGFFIAPTGEPAQQDDAGAMQAAVEIHREMLPLYIPVHLGQRVLQAGQHGIMMRSASGASGDRVLLARDSCEMHACLTAGDELLRDGVLASAVLEDMVRAAGEILGIRLWRLCKHEQRLEQVLQGLGDFFLCFKGEMWRTYVTESCHAVGAFLVAVLKGHVRDLRVGLARLRTQLSDAYAGAVKHSFGSTASLDGHLPRFTPALPPDRKGDADLVQLLEDKRRAVSAHPGDDSEVSVKFAPLFMQFVTNVSMSMPVEWPLSDIFDTSSFNLLRRNHCNIALLLHAEVALTESWRHLMTASRMVAKRSRGAVAGDGRAARSQRIAQGRRMLRPLLLVRRRMSFFIANLKTFVLTDVLHEQYAMLQGELLRDSDQRTYSSAKELCTSGLRRMAGDAFTQHESEGRRHDVVARRIQGAISQCVLLWTIVRQTLGDVQAPHEVDAALFALSAHHSAAHGLGQAFDEHTARLYSVLKGNELHLHYKQLLDRLDFNKWFSMSLRERSEPRSEQSAARPSGAASR
eukprot:TRINITY_DN25200_c0_g1_i1.p1 TRINITY_DN25200_c0_g1~~TRINITY_DN25200_c0_g1_i1.p1  ORF type:complete len:745 (+),score=188.16 TRINITY_DN25200_c0_g1_i1:83-2236(+)